MLAQSKFHIGLLTACARKGPGPLGPFLTACTALRAAWARRSTWTIPAASRFYTLVSHLILLSYAEYIGVYTTAPVGTVIHKDALRGAQERITSLSHCYQSSENNKQCIFALYIKATGLHKEYATLCHLSIQTTVVLA